jgi:hypothetical protein
MLLININAKKNFKFKIDKTAFSVSSFDEKSDEKKYWQTKSIEERLLALEFMRQIFYGYNPITERLQRIFSIAEFKSS